MATDARGHTVPAGSDVFNPQGDAVTTALTINDFVSVANGTAKAALLAAVGASSARPLTVYQQDTDTFERSIGSTFRIIGRGGAWTTYTPTWAGLSTTQPSVGNGSIAGRYQINNGSLTGHVQLIVGTSGASGGSGTGNWSVSVPTASLSPINVSVGGWLNGATLSPLAARIPSGTSVMTDLIDRGGAVLTVGYFLPPGTIILLEYEYEI